MNDELPTIQKEYMFLNNWTIIKIIKKEYPFDGSICGGYDRSDELASLCTKVFVFVISLFFIALILIVIKG